MKMCSIEDCGNPIKARTWCNSHYMRWRKHGDPAYQRPKPDCSIEDCTKQAIARGWCGTHWARWSKHGDPTTLVAFTDPEDSFTARAAWDGEHLIWTGASGKYGHGYIAVNRKMVAAHRYSWERLNGPIPDGMWIDHTCHTPACVLPDHLRLATPRQNGQNRSGANPGRDLPRGVYRSGRKYQAAVRIEGVLRCFGNFPTPEQASAAAAEARSIHFGAFAGGN